MGMGRERLVRQLAVIRSIKPPQIYRAFLVDKAPQQGIALRVVARCRQRLFFAALRDVVADGSRMMQMKTLLIERAKPSATLISAWFSHFSKTA